jgi:hypothetical protein
MDIIIKSFNRAYYLDRCLYSIYENVIDSDFTIKIIDDGTPQKYLDKLLEKYPNILIYKSEFYEEKTAKIENDISDFRKPLSADIPINLWIQAAENASDYFLLLEDDIWITEKINLNEIEQKLVIKKVHFLKLFWLNNPKLIVGKTLEKNSFFSIFKPMLTTKNPFLYRFIFMVTRFKIRKAVSFFGLYSKEKALHYYSIYSVAGVVFKKKYFLALWKNHKNTVDEGLQLFNAVKYLYKNKNVNFALSNNEVVQTGFLSSATNQHKNYQNINLDVFALNKILNESWFNNEFDVIDNFPKDLNSKSIESILDIQNHPSAQKVEWKKWVDQFKNQFIAIGCKID